MSKTKTILIYLGICLAFLWGYTEWGTDQHSFIWQMVIQIFQQDGLLKTLSHPLILAGLGGLLLLLSAVIFRPSRPFLPLSGIILLGLVMLVFTIVGMITGNLKIMASTLPFWMLSVIYFIKIYRNKK